MLSSNFKCILQQQSHYEISVSYANVRIIIVVFLHYTTDISG